MNSGSTDNMTKSHDNQCQAADEIHVLQVMPCIALLTHPNYI